MSEERIVAAKDAPAAKPADAVEPHYADLNERLTEQLRNFRAAGEALGLLLVENIKFNRDKLSEFFDKFEAIKEALPDVDAVLKACDDLAEFKKRLDGAVADLDTKFMGQLTTLNNTVNGLVASQQERAQRDGQPVDLTSVMSLVTTIRDQAVDLENRFSALYERVTMVDQSHRDTTGEVHTRHDNHARATAARFLQIENRVTELEGRVANLPTNLPGRLIELRNRIERLEPRSESGQQNEGGTS
jgi:hypothetical protein